MQCVIPRKVYNKVEKSDCEDVLTTFVLPIYPKQLEEHINSHEQSFMPRPIKMEDSVEHQPFFFYLSPVDIHTRFFYSMRELPACQLAKLTDIDYDCEMALVASRKRVNGSNKTLGVARGIADAENK